LGEREQHIRAHDSRDRTRAVHSGVPVLGEPVARLLVDVQSDSAAAEPVGDILKSKRDDLQNGLAGELVEDEHRVEPVEQLGREVFGGEVEDLLSGFRRHRAIIRAGSWLRQNIAAEVTG